METKTPQTLKDAITYFSEPQNCVDYMVARRWPNGVKCPVCGSKKVKYDPKSYRWQCASHHPKRKFSLKTGTVLEDSPIGLDKWLPVMWLVSNCKNGIGSLEIHRSVGVTQKTAWFMLQRARLALQGTKGGKLGGPMGEPVEIDETYIGGKSRNMHSARRRATFNGRAGKAIVMGILERHGEVRTKVISHTANSQIRPVVTENVEFGTIINSDLLGEQWQMPQHFIHEMVNHQAEEYVRGNVHTNGIEKFLEPAKRGIHGTYINVEPFHLFRYVDEQAFRYNHRKHENGDKKTDAERFEVAVSQIVGKRVTYAELTGHTEEAF